jgi:diguanylate cyclase (GGDEF)-like protein/PAS domain S-box-containing protein
MQKSRRTRKIPSDASVFESIMAQISMRKPLLDLLQSLCLAIEAHFHNAACAISMVARDENHLIQGAAPNLPDNFADSLNGVPMEGRWGVFFTTIPPSGTVNFADIARDWSDGAPRNLALAAGFKACWAKPIVDAKKRILGALTIFNRELLRPDPEECRLIAQIAALACMVIEHYSAIEELQASRERLSLALEGSNLALFDIDVLNGEIFLSEAWSAMLGGPWEPTRTTLATLLESVHPEDRASLREQYVAGLKSTDESGYQCDHRFKLPSGAYLWIQSRGKVVERDAQGQALRVAGTNSDLSERKKAEERIHYLAYYDYVTGLPNRRMLGDALARSIERARRHQSRSGILFIDVDRFKLINDTLGHVTGDMVLQTLGQRLVHCVRGSDMVFRLGGDEFGVLVDGVKDPQSLFGLARKILDALATPMSIQQTPIQLTASIGVSIYPDDALDQAELIRNAELAMYRAKDAGKNTFQYHSAEMNVASSDRHALESSLRGALARNEFAVHYQPQVGTSDGSTRGVEALLRWRHPKLGTVAPGSFIPIAEELGLIDDIGKWVLRQACEQAVAWHNAGMPAMIMAVNLSPYQFLGESLVADVVQILDATGMHPQQLELEITESAIMSNLDGALKCLEELKQLGIGLAIDDFGTGYSSLASLKRFPVTTLKLDGSFIEDVPKSEIAKAIAGAVIAMAHSLGLKAVAEGVETAEQLHWLTQAGCDEVQGFYLSPALSGEQLEAFLAQAPVSSAVH